MSFVDALTRYKNRWWFEQIRIKSAFGVFQKGVIIIGQVLDVQTESAFGNDIHGEDAEDSVQSSFESINRSSFVGWKHAGSYFLASSLPPFCASVVNTATNSSVHLVINEDI